MRHLFDERRRHRPNLIATLADGLWLTQLFFKSKVDRRLDTGMTNHTIFKHVNTQKKCGWTKKSMTKHDDVVWKVSAVDVNVIIVLTYCVKTFLVFVWLLIDGTHTCGETLRILKSRPFFAPGHLFISFLSICLTVLSFVLHRGNVVERKNAVWTLVSDRC